MLWLSLVPFSTARLSATRFAEAPTTLYGLTLLAPGAAYHLLSKSLIAAAALRPSTADAIGADVKGKISVGLYT